jgi:hypothetical protein
MKVFAAFMLFAIFLLLVCSMTFGQSVAVTQVRHATYPTNASSQELYIDESFRALPVALRLRVALFHQGMDIQFQFVGEVLE